ncbi:hypothetical protein RJT34_03875 [Clitoria ternatea]|uniref:Uncharacterized protein n=1 Tax=Clitoria ternatea TaxID=43366 RepID=A0AAN9Q246_CLITE
MRAYICLPGHAYAQALCHVSSSSCVGTLESACPCGCVVWDPLVLMPCFLVCVCAHGVCASGVSHAWARWCAHARHVCVVYVVTGVPTLTPGHTYAQGLFLGTTSRDAEQREEKEREDMCDS